MCSAKSYIRDTSDFLKKLTELGSVPQNVLLVKADVVGLYPSIPHRHLLEALSINCVWWRYIDDIFFVWTHGKDELYKFLERLNSSHPKLRFRSECSGEEISFLDVTVKLNNNQLLQIPTVNLQIPTNTFTITLVTQST